MSRKTVRDYGFLVLCTLGLMIGFMIYRHYKQDVLAYSLDLIGDRLVGMVADEANRASVQALYDSFKERVLARGVSPERVEQVAANVLNLEHTGATLTPWQARVMLAAFHPDSAVAVSPERPVDPAQLEALGQRLKSVCDFDERIHRMAAVRRALGEKVHYDCKEGLRLSVDRKVREMLPEQDFERFIQELKPLERDKMVVWRDNLAAELRETRRRIREEMKALDGLELGSDPEMLEALKGLEALRDLERQGHYLDEAFIRETVSKRLKEAEARLKALKSKTEQQADQNTS